MKTTSNAASASRGIRYESRKRRFTSMGNRRSPSPENSSCIWWKPPRRSPNTHSTIWVSPNGATRARSTTWRSPTRTPQNWRNWTTSLPYRNTSPAVPISMSFRRIAAIGRYDRQTGKDRGRDPRNEIISVRPGTRTAQGPAPRKRT